MRFDPGPASREVIELDSIVGSQDRVSLVLWRRTHSNHCLTDLVNGSCVSNPDEFQADVTVACPSDVVGAGTSTGFKPAFELGYELIASLTGQMTVLH